MKSGKLYIASQFHAKNHAIMFELYTILAITFFCQVSYHLQSLFLFIMMTVWHYYCWLFPVSKFIDEIAYLYKYMLTC